MNNLIRQITKDIYEHIITNQELTIHFQPIVSVDKERIIGCEALMRAGYHGEPIDAEALFNYVRNQHNERELDFICRKKAVLEFLNIHKDVMLFINFESALINDYLKDLDIYIDALESFSINKEKIVVEINEKHAGDNEGLIEFVSRLKKHGFLIALDDVGVGYSNLNRIVLTKPDIIKIDRSTIREIQNNYYKCEIVRSITDLASRIGAVVIAEGVEEKEEIFTCLSLGINLFQGFFFSKAISCHDFIGLDCDEITRFLSHEFKIRAENEIIRKAERGFSRKFILQKLIQLLMRCNSYEYDGVINKFFGEYVDVECVYLLDHTGRQITNTFFNTVTEFKSPYLFSPAKQDDYHIVKPYYYVVMHKKNEVYISDRYISAATGHFCETYSSIFNSYDREELILCIDFSVKAT